jgi:hypothetical protein
MDGAVAANLGLSNDVVQPSLSYGIVQVDYFSSPLRRAHVLRGNARRPKHYSTCCLLHKTPLQLIAAVPKPDGYLGSVCGFLLAAARMHDCTPRCIPPVSEIALAF